MGLLAYVDHDNQREKPVYFKWQILDWNNENSEEVINNENIGDIQYNKIDTKKFVLKLRDQDEEYSYSLVDRKGKNTKEFYSNKNINFEGEIKKNTAMMRRLLFCHGKNGWEHLMVLC